MISAPVRSASIPEPMIGIFFAIFPRNGTAFGPSFVVRNFTGLARRSFAIFAFPATNFAAPVTPFFTLLIPDFTLPNIRPKKPFGFGAPALVGFGAPPPPPADAPVDAPVDAPADVGVGAVVGTAPAAADAPVVAAPLIPSILAADPVSLEKVEPKPPTIFLSIPPLPNIFAKFFLRGLITFLNSFIRKNRKASFGFLIRRKPVLSMLSPDMIELKIPFFFFSSPAPSTNSPPPSMFSRASTILSSRRSSSFSFSTSDFRDSAIIDAVLLVAEQIHLRSSSIRLRSIPPPGDARPIASGAGTACSSPAPSTPATPSTPSASAFSRAVISASRAAFLCFLALRTRIMLPANLPTKPPPKAPSTRLSAVGSALVKASLRTLTSPRP